MKKICLGTMINLLYRQGRAEVTECAMFADGFLRSSIVILMIIAKSFQAILRAYTIRFRRQFMTEQLI